MGYKAVAVNEKANEVRELLIRAREQYEKFGEVLERARRKLDDAGKALDEARDRNRIINDKFKRVEMLDRED